jgi:hypothetical protein
VPQVAVTVPVKPDRVTALLLMVELVLTPVWLVKLKATGLLPATVVASAVQLEPLQYWIAFVPVLKYSIPS